MPILQHLVKYQKCFALFLIILVVFFINNVMQKNELLSLFGNGSDSDKDEPEYENTNSPAATNADKILLCDDANSVRDSSIYATIFKSEESRIKVSESFNSHFNYEIRYTPTWSQKTHPHVYLIDFNQIERDFILTLSPLIVSMECEIPLNPEMVYCAAMGCTDSAKWPHSFR